jgi:nitroreductase
MEKEMDLKEVIEKRKSIRHYEGKPIPEDKLMKVLEAARLAPSAHNGQSWKFIVVKDANTRQKLCRAAEGQSQVGEAPVIIAAVATSPRDVMKCGVPTYAVDLAIAIDHMTLSAADEGLGSCWIGRFSQEEAKAALGVPDDCQLVTILPLGFPAETGRQKTRKSLEEIVCYEKFH